MHIWGGDFNFVPDVARDRRRQPGADVVHHHQDVATQRQFADSARDMSDVFRERHSVRRTYTFWASTTAGQSSGRVSASRIDRFYAHQRMMPYISRCTVNGSTLSDHRPVLMELLGRSDKADPSRRVRMDFVDSSVLRRALSTWLHGQILQEPDEDHARLVWWPGFKRRLAKQCWVLNRQYRQMHNASLRQADKRMLQAYQHVERDDTASLQAVVEARKGFCEAIHAQLADERRCRRVQWLHDGERPSPHITRMFRGGRNSSGAQCLRDPGNGRWVTGGRACADLVVRTWADVSAAPVADLPATTEVLAAVGVGPVIPDDMLSSLASVEVSIAEVKEAMSHTKPGKSPGPDGLPVELYREFSLTFAPLLSRLYTSVGNTHHTLPAGFTDGLISLIHKDGNAHEVCNYRPITLLNTDYRLLAKVLAQRLIPALMGVISKEQSAFLPLREIGDNVMLMQLLPHWLGKERSAWVVFCDFCKAYDTINREFLFKVMGQLNVGDGFIAWARALLTDTHARARFNGFESKSASFDAGVRQGCPLAPLLYLFVAEALLRLLKARGVGLAEHNGVQLTAAQFADDTEVFLPDLDAVPPFLEAMAVFARASGQGLNKQKTKLMFVGGSPHQQPTAERAHGIAVVKSVTALGMHFSNRGTPTDAAHDGYWEKLVQRVYERYEKIARCNSFSMFGRAFAASAYGVARMLYHAEFSDIPPETIGGGLAAATARLIDGGCTPGDTTRRFTRVRAELHTGNPVDGGFGALPWQQHIYSRHARWAARLATGDVGLQWIAVARSMLPSPYTPVSILMCPAGATMGRALHRAIGECPPLMRLWRAVARLPAPHVQPYHAPDSTDVALPGPWCCNAPLWANPWLQDSSNGGATLEHRFSELAESGTLTTVGDLLAMLEELTVRGGSIASMLLAVRTRVIRMAMALGRGGQSSRSQLQDLQACVPDLWVQAAASTLLGPSRGNTEVCDIPTRAHEPIFWRSSDMIKPAVVVGASMFSVRAGTDVQMAPARTIRFQKLASFVGEALQTDENDSATHVAVQDTLLPMLRWVWKKVKWENGHKEAWWLLAHDGFPTAARMHKHDACACCQTGRSSRRHHFWECPVSKGIITAIEEMLRIQCSGMPPLSCGNFWLLNMPACCQKRVGKGSWAVACLAGIEAMDSARAYGYKLSLEEPLLASNVRLQRLQRYGLARFWDLVADFVYLGGEGALLIAGLANARGGEAPAVPAVP